jgi:hypothetical protein
MIKITGITLFVGAAIAAASALGGCSSSSSGSPALATSAEGESCSRTSDCANDLACIANTCLPKGSSVSDGGVVIGPDGSVMMTTPTGGPEAGPTQVPEAAPPRLSALGQGCERTADCSTGLVCIPSSPYGALGVCDVASYGLTASGKTCSGECNTGADCCELPVTVPAIGGVAVHNCQDILTSVLGGSATACSQSPGAATAVGIGCFYYATYCSTCATSNVWACTNSQCVYSKSCQNSGNELNGCPSQTRTARGLTTNCDTASNTCKPAATIGTCTIGAADTTCDGVPTNDSGIVCHGGDCTCYQQGCYEKCSADLDCRQGYHCDAAGTKLCQQNTTCSVDSDCAVSTDVTTAKCSNGACKVPCTSDHDCGGSGLVHGYAIATFGGEVCGADGFCDALGCASDMDCQNTGSNPGGSTVHLFCVTPATPMTTPVVQSAITSH